MTEMIAAEPMLAERLIHRLTDDAAVGQLAAAIRDAAAAGQPIVTTGCGTSEHAAMGVAALLTEALTPRPGREARAVGALESVARPLADGILIGVSHEGGTHVTNEALRAARAAGARTALITVGGGSPGAELAEVVVRTGEQDQSWCHTVGYLSPLVAGVVLAARLTRSRPDALATSTLLEVSRNPQRAAAIATRLTDTDRLIVPGSGPDHISARELALKVSEGARVPATALELETVLHGYLAAATPRTGLILVLTDTQPGASKIRERAARVLAAATALSLPTAAILAAAIADAVPADHTSAGRIVLPSVARVDGIGGRLLGAAMALQTLTERMARARGVNPDTLGREEPAQAAAHA